MVDDTRIVSGFVDDMSNTAFYGTRPSRLVVVDMEMEMEMGNIQVRGASFDRPHGVDTLMMRRYLDLRSDRV